MLAYKETSDKWFTFLIQKFCQFVHNLSTNKNRSYYNIKSMRPRKKNNSVLSNLNTEHSNDTLNVKIKRKLFPQYPIPLLHSFLGQTASFEIMFKKYIFQKKFPNSSFEQIRSRSVHSRICSRSFLWEYVPEVFVENMFQKFSFRICSRSFHSKIWWMVWY